MTMLDDDFDGATEAQVQNSGSIFNLSDVKADVSGGFEPLPAGLYNCVVEDCSYGQSKNSGSWMLTWKFKVVNGDHASRTVFDWTILIGKDKKSDPRGLAKLKAYLQVVAPDYPLEKFDPAVFAYENAAINALCILKLKINPAKGDRQASNGVVDILPYEEGVADGGLSLGDSADDII